MNDVLLEIINFFKNKYPSYPDSVINNISYGIYDSINEVIVDPDKTFSFISYDNIFKNEIFTTSSAIFDLYNKNECAHFKFTFTAKQIIDCKNNVIYKDKQLLEDVLLTNNSIKKVKI